MNKCGLSALVTRRYLKLAALGTKMYLRLAALVTEMCQGLAALVTSRYCGAVIPSYKKVESNTKKDAVFV